MKIVIFNVFLILTGVLTAQDYNKYDTDGKRHGKWLKKYEGSDQVRYMGTFDHGREVGEFKFYKPNSGDTPTAVKLFSKDSDSVLVKYYTSKGKVISEGKMVGKTREGQWKYYHNGSNKIMMIENYKNDKLDGEQKTFFDNGQLTEQTFYKNGRREGKRLIYSEEGKLMKEFTYEDDLLHGVTKYYDLDGKLQIEGNYKKNKKDGVWKYYRDGKLDEQKLFPLHKRG